MLLDLQNLFSDNQELRKTSEISDNTVKFSKGEIIYLVKKPEEKYIK